MGKYDQKKSKKSNIFDYERTVERLRFSNSKKKQIKSDKNKTETLIHFTTAGTVATCSREELVILKSKTVNKIIVSKSL